MTKWCPNLSASDAPRYLAIADSIESDLKSGRLTAGDRLPAQRQLAGLLGLDFTTVARGYAEANRRGLISSKVGSGTFVTRPNAYKAPDQITGKPRRSCPPDQSMNLPPEPDSVDLVARMQDGYSALSADLVPLLRYQTFEVGDLDIQAAQSWLAQSGTTTNAYQIVITPGAQAALNSIVSIVANPGDTLLCEAITYPGIRSVCAQQNISLIGLDMDDDGIVPTAVEEACKSHKPKAIYLNPTLHNPTTRTIPPQRRNEIVAVARRYGVAILEDDAYGRLKELPPASFATIAPDLTWHIASLSKTVGAGLRLAYVSAPIKKTAWQLARALRISCVMPSPLTVALATRWIEDGTAGALLEFIRLESRARQDLARLHLPDIGLETDTDGFHIWLRLKNGWSRSSLISQLRDHPIGVIESDAFAVSGPAPNAARLCLGGPCNRDDLTRALDLISHTLDASPEQNSAYF